MYTLYWIHTQSHTNPATQGYVGITKRDPQRRLKTHSNPTVIKRRDAGKVLLTILESDLSEESAKLKEFELRPVERIGWNIAPGGDLPPSQGSYDHSNRKTKNRGAKRSEAQILGDKVRSTTMKGKPAWNKGKTGVSSGWTKGKPRETPVWNAGKTYTTYKRPGSNPAAKAAAAERNSVTLTCPKCGKVGKGAAIMKRWHFDNCKGAM